MEELVFWAVEVVLVVVLVVVLDLEEVVAVGQFQPNHWQYSWLRKSRFCISRLFTAAEAVTAAVTCTVVARSAVWVRAPPMVGPSATVVAAASWAKSST